MTFVFAAFPIGALIGERKPDPDRLMQIQQNYSLICIAACLMFREFREVFKQPK